MTTTLMTTISTDGTARTRTPTSTPAREREMLAFFPEAGLSDLKPGTVGPDGRIPPARRPRTTRPRTTLRTTRRTARTAFSPPARAKEMLAFFPEAGLSDLKPGTVGPDGRIPPARRPRTTRPRTTLRTTRRTARTAFSPPARAKEMLANPSGTGLGGLKGGTP